jgi:methane/ammonia monooxygenase subunit B
MTLRAAAANVIHPKLSRSLAAAMLTLCGLLSGGSAYAHGERAQEPSLRLSTIQWYDTTWSSEQIGVNQELVVSGRFHIMSSWPLEIPSPERLTFLNVGVPGPVFVRTASEVNGVNGVSSMALELGKDYSYKIFLRGRVPGRYHVHPMLDVLDAGALLGPGQWVTVTGDANAFNDPVTTLTGHNIDLATFGLRHVIRTHVVWVVIALTWLAYWIRKPLLMPRYEAVQAGDGDRLITRSDRMMAAVMLALTLALAIVGYAIANVTYPVTIPLQSHQTRVAGLAEPPSTITIQPEEVTYLVPGRSVQMRLRIANHGTHPVTIGEFTTANLRFLNNSVTKPDRAYPSDLIAPAGLVVRPDRGLAPGEDAEYVIEATSPVWETDRLAALLADPTNRIGGLFMFFDPAGHRSVVEFSSPIVPTFTGHHDVGS